MIASFTSSPLRLVILSAAACNCSIAWAAGGAHEHGAAELLLSSEGKDVQITFNAPAQSLVGFETAAVTEEQKAAVARAQAILMAPRDLFAVEGNSCELIDVTVDVSSLVGVGNAPSQAEAHDDHSDEHADHASSRGPRAHPNDRHAPLPAMGRYQHLLARKHQRLRRSVHKSCPLPQIGHAAPSEWPVHAPLPLFAPR